MCGRYAADMRRYAADMQWMCNGYAADMQRMWSRYAANMQHSRYAAIGSILPKYSIIWRWREKKEEEEEDELLDFKKHSIFIDVLKKGIIFMNLKKLIFIQVLNYIPKLRGFVILWKKLSVVLTYLHTQTVTKRQERKNYSPNIF